MILEEGVLRERATRAERALGLSQVPGSSVFLNRDAPSLRYRIVFLLLYILVFCGFAARLRLASCR